MDPDACLSEMLEIAHAILNEHDGDMQDASERLADLTEALDGWLSIGGFLPKRWSDK